jgi:peptidoglycan/xylan/chitin deacetylase (PgdA/CDA1 family)
MVFRAAQELGLKIVQWNAMGYDWQPIPPERIVANVTRGIERAQRRHTGANILLHDGHQQGIGVDRSATVHATAQLLQGFAQKGIRTVTVDAWI